MPDAADGIGRVMAFTPPRRPTHAMKPARAMPDTGKAGAVRFRLGRPCRQ
jgi:hypothetical protein